MKKFLVISSIALFASCSTTIINTVPPTKDVHVSVTADLDISQERITHRYIHRGDGGVTNAQNWAIIEALRLNGNADVLIAPQYEIKIKGFTIEVNVSGYPAKYKNIRSVSIDGNVNNNPLKLEVNQPLEISSIEANKPAILGDELEILETNAKNGNVEDQFTLGMTYLDKNKTDLAVSWLKKAAQAKHMEAQYELGSWYLREGFPYPAKKWLKKAADQGHKEAKELLKNL